MEYNINENENVIKVNGKELKLYSEEGFKALSDLWVKVGWDQKHLYSFSWLGRPIIQLPDDALRIQEVIYDLQPDVIVETGVAHGGSLIYYASICHAIGKGKVVGVDIEIRPHNRKEIESHKMFEYITLIEGDSVAQNVLDKVKANISEGDKVLVILDSNHSYEHVLKELNAYSSFVTKGSYIVATDGVQKYVKDVPRATEDYKEWAKEWDKDNPVNAIEDFLKTTSEFVCSEPRFPFQEGNINFRITHWPQAYLKRV